MEIDSDQNLELHRNDLPPSVATVCDEDEILYLWDGNFFELYSYPKGCYTGQVKVHLLDWHAFEKSV